MEADITYAGDLPCYVLVGLFNNLKNGSLSNVDDWNNADVFQIITRESVKMLTDSWSIFDRLCNVADWDVDWIAQYRDDKIQTVI